MNKHFKKKANAVWRKMNGQTFPKTEKCSLEKKRTGKHFEKQTKVVLGKFKYKRTNILKNKRTNISKNSKMQFGEKMNGQ